MNTFIFLRHAETEKDSTKNAADWILSEKGFEESKNLTQLPIFQNLDLIFTSSEVKSVLTAKPLAVNLDLEIIRMPEFDEVRRSNTFLSTEEFNIHKKRQLEDLNFAAFDGETGNEALRRFRTGLKKLNENYNDKKILIVSHGTILTIYFAHQKGIFDDLNGRWSKTKFCSYGIIRDKEIIKDIID